MGLTDSEPRIYVVTFTDKSQPLWVTKFQMDKLLEWKRESLKKLKDDIELHVARQGSQFRKTVCYIQDLDIKDYINA